MRRPIAARDLAVNDDTVTPPWDRRVPDDEDTQETSSAFDVPVTARQLDRGAEAARRHGRDPDSALTAAEFDARISALIRRLRDEQTSERSKQAKELRELLDRPPRDATQRLVRDVAKLKRQVKQARVVAGALITLVLGGVGGAAKWLYTRGGEEQAIQMRIQRNEQDIEALRRMQPYQNRDRTEP